MSAAYGVAHHRIPPRSPNHNAVCERFQGTALQECWRPAFHRRRFERLTQLRAELESWLVTYNTRRPNDSDFMCGRTPRQVLDHTERTEQHDHQPQGPAVTSTRGPEDLGRETKAGSRSDWLCLAETLCPMVFAVSQQREVPDVQLEAVAAAQRRAELIEQLGWDVDDFSAVFADEVLVNVAEMVHGRSVADVGVLDHPEFFERVEGPVDGGQVHLGMCRLDDRGEVFGVDVRVGGEDRLDDQAARRCDPAAPLANLVEDLVNSEDGHRHTVYARARSCKPLAKPGLRDIRRSGWLRRDCSCMMSATAV